VGRPDSTDPDVVARYVLSRFEEPEDEVREIVDRAADEVERLVREIAEEEADPLGEVID
jgi:PTH1 family peptidyl-tRNA hydrolase